MAKENEEVKLPEGSEDPKVVETRVDKMLDPRGKDAPVEVSKSNDSLKEISAKIDKLGSDSEVPKPKPAVVDKHKEQILSAPEVPKNSKNKAKPEIKKPNKETDNTNTAKIADSVGQDDSTEDNSTSQQPEHNDKAHDDDNSANSSENKSEQNAEDSAVDDIVSKEGDVVLKAEDEKQKKAIAVPRKASFGRKVVTKLKNLWSKPYIRRTALGLALAIVVATVAVPTSRYFVMNTAGIRSRASITVFDNSTKLPLKNVTVSMSGLSVQTDKNGLASFKNIKLGKTIVKIEKRAFAEITQVSTIGWGSNPLGELSLTPVGSQYDFMVTDFLSGNPIKGIEATSGIASALSDDEGKIKLTIDSDDIPETDEIKATISGEGYRDEVITIDAKNKEATLVSLVPARKHVFISKRSGQYDVYKIDADGKNEGLLLKGTGSERSDITLALHPNFELAALVSTRDNLRNSDGFLLSTLTIINVAEEESPAKVISSERIQLVGWSGTRLVFVKIAAGASASNPKRHRLISYDTKTSKSNELASSNYFNDVSMVGNIVYYSPSSAYQNQATSLRSVNADGNNDQVVLNKEVWNVFRLKYDELVLSVSQEWHSYDITTKKITLLDGQPADLRSRVYTDNPKQDKSLWIDKRDGKGVLLIHDITNETNEDEVLHTASGLNTPVTWLNDNIVLYRIRTDSETADYVMNINGGEHKKLVDVTNTGGLDNWYYY